MQAFVFLAHHLVGDDVFQRDVVFFDDGLEILDGTFHLVLCEGLLHGVALELDTYGEEVTPLPAVEH